MKTVLVHAVLLFAALGLAYQTWTRDDAEPAVLGSVTLWNEDREDITSIVYESAATRVVIEQRRDTLGSYLWASVTSDPGAGNTAAADLGGPKEFLVGERADTLLRSVAAPRASRDLGSVGAEREDEYGLSDSPARLTVHLGDDTLELIVGRSVFATGDRYVKDPVSGRVYVLPGTMVNDIENAVGMLTERRPHAFPFSRISTVTVRTPRGERTMHRAQPSPSSPPSWTPRNRPDQPDQTFANFMDRLQALWLTDFAPTVDRGLLQQIVRVDYQDANGNALGHIDLFRADNENGPLYYVVTEHTRVLAQVYPSTAETLDQDVAQLF